MKKNEMSKTGVFDIAAFDKNVKMDMYSVASLILAIRESGYYSTLTDWILKYPVPPGTIPCRETPVKCMLRLNELKKKNAIDTHPTHQLDLIVTERDAVVTNLGVTCVEDGKVKNYGVNVGYLVADLGDSLRVIHANTAEVVATDAKYDKKGYVTSPEWPEKYDVPLSNAIAVRSHTESVVPSRAKARDEIYSFLMRPQNMVSTLRIHSKMADTLPSYCPVPALTEALKKYYIRHKKPIPEDVDVRVVSTDNSPIAFIEDIDSAYKMYFKSVSIRGGRDGKGVTHGFERFCMSRTNANVLNIVQDFYNMSDLYGCSSFVIRDSSYLSVEQIRVLVFNKFRIIQMNTMFPKCFVDSPPGLYSSYESKVNPVEYMVLPDAMVKPLVDNSVVTMGRYYDEAIKRIGKVKRAFCFMYIDKRLMSYKSELSFLPSATVDTMQIIVATGVQKTYPLPRLVKRATMGISCRNRFLTSRKPFSTIDIMGDFVRWDRQLYYPAVHERAKGKALDLQKIPIADGSLQFVPMDVNMKNFVNVLEQEPPVELTIPELFHEAMVQDAEYIIRVLIGNTDIVKPDKFKFLKDDEIARWNSKFDPLLTLSDAEVRRSIYLFDDGASKMLFDKIFYEIYGNVEAKDEDVVESAYAFGVDDEFADFRQIRIDVERH